MWFTIFFFIVVNVQEDERKREEKDERKRKYNVKWNDEVISISFIWKFLHFSFVPPPLKNCFVV